jgi:hypothetical protein
MGFALSTNKTPSTPATKRLTIENVYSDAEPDAFHDQVTRFFENRRKAVDKIVS